jgi:hypothetical protein
MSEIINHQSSIINRERGVVLLVVLFVIIAITIISVGFLSRCDVELACGQNMLMRTQMDQLADSGLEHARGLLLHPQDLTSEYWLGAAGQQLVAGSAGYYDVTVTPDGSDPSDYCTYSITSQAYEVKGGQRVGQSSLRAQLRLDPCIALWLGAATTLTSGWTVHGDVRCGTTLANYGAIDGDVFANSMTGTGSQTGRLAAPGGLTLTWPEVSAASFMSHYTTHSLTSPLSDQTYGPYNPPQIFSAGSLRLDDNVTINGMLLVCGDLVIHGNHVKIIGGKNLPAMYVTGNLVIDEISDLQIEGLAIVEGEIQLNDGAAGMSVRGGLFAASPIRQTLGHSANCSYAYIYGTPAWDPAGGQIDGALRFDGADDYIDVGSESEFDLASQITVAAWIKVAAFNHDFQPIVTKGDSAWRIQRWSNTDHIEFACTDISYNPPHGSLVGTANVNDGRWHHVAGVYNNHVAGDTETISLYVDGSLDASATVTPARSIHQNSARVMIGRNAEQLDRFWNGWIDDVRIYDRALSQNEITTIKDGGWAADLVVRWKLDESGANVTVAADPAKAAIVIWPGGTRTYWGPAAGAFFRSIHRN